MPGLIHLVRHGEATHNVSKDFTEHDPLLTAAGISQGYNLARIFPHHARIGAVVASPLRRTIQTALAGFAPILKKDYFEGDVVWEGAGGKEFYIGDGKGEVNLILELNAQERSGYACDTGSPAPALAEFFPTVAALHDFQSTLPADWFSKTGIYAADDATVKARAAKLRAQLKSLLEELGGKDVVVVMHGGIMKEVLEDPEIDLPKCGWVSVSFDGDKLVKKED